VHPTVRREDRTIDGFEPDLDEGHALIQLEVEIGDDLERHVVVGARLDLEGVDRRADEGPTSPAAIAQTPEITARARDGPGRQMGREPHERVGVGDRQLDVLLRKAEALLVAAQRERTFAQVMRNAVPLPRFGDVLLAVVDDVFHVFRPDQQRSSKMQVEACVVEVFELRKGGDEDVPAQFMQDFCVANSHDKLLSRWSGMHHRHYRQARFRPRIGGAFWVKTMGEVPASDEVGRRRSQSNRVTESELNPSCSDTSSKPVKLKQRISAFLVRN
jgi:hypothetical protein